MSDTTRETALGNSYSSNGIVNNQLHLLISTFKDCARLMAGRSAYRMDRSRLSDTNLLALLFISYALAIAGAPFTFFDVSKALIMGSTPFLFVLGIVKLNLATASLRTGLYAIACVTVWTDIFLFFLSSVKHINIVFFALQFIGFSCALNCDRKIGLFRSSLFALAVYGVYYFVHLYSGLIDAIQLPDLMVVH